MGAAFDALALWEGAKRMQRVCTFGEPRNEEMAPPDYDVLVRRGNTQL